MAKREVIQAALYAYANPYDPDSPCDHTEAIDLAVEFLETFAGLKLDACATPGGKTYSYSWILNHLRHAFGEAPAHVPIQFLMELGLIRTELLDFEDEGEAQPTLPGVADT